MGKVGGVCVLQAGKLALDVGWAREESKIGRGREGESAERERGFWNGLPFLALAGLFIAEGRRRGAWFLLKKFCGGRKKFCSY